MFLNTILEGVASARSKQIENQLLLQNSTPTGANEFLFFIKPELLLDDPAIQFETLIKMILGKIEEFDLKIGSVRALSAGYLEKHGIIAQHYGVINQIASHAKTMVSHAGKENFTSIFGENFETANVLGGLEMLKAYPQFTAETLDYIWQNVKFEKLAGGTYASKLSLDGNPVYLVNGFHGRQLEHFTQAGRCIIVFSLIGDINWSDARTRFIGATCPADAETGSIRKTLLENTQSFGLKAVTPSWNGVHLSAGPIEGLIELIRYQSDFESGQSLQASDFDFGKALINTFGEEKTASLLTNPTVQFEGQAISIFDLTEEKNASTSIELLKTVL